MPRPIFYLAALVSFATFADCRSHHRRQELQGVVHTFDTREYCMSKCRTTCTQHQSEDLKMMPRWQCLQQGEDGSALEEEEESSFAGNLLLIVPAVVVGALVFLFCCISCLQRFCRNDD